MAVYPIPVGRSSDALLTRRLLTQMQAEQKRLLQVEQQLGTGRRIQLSSEDPSSAGRAVTLQRMLEYKVQLQTNLSAGQSFLGATDTALGSVSNLLSEAARLGDPGSRQHHERHGTPGDHVADPIDRSADVQYR